MMMCSPKIMGMLAIVPSAVLLTISFFVLVVLRKLDKDGLKAFGYVVVALLWVCALMVFSSGIYALSSGKRGITGMMKRMHCPGQQNMSAPMMMHNPQGNPMGSDIKGH